MKARRGSCFYFILYFAHYHPFDLTPTFCPMDTTSFFQHYVSAPTGASGPQSRPIQRLPPSATLHATRSREDPWRVTSSNPELKTPTQETTQGRDFTDVEVNVHPPFIKPATYLDILDFGNRRTISGRAG